MHGLTNKAIEVFVKQTYGTAKWQNVMEKAGFGFSEFEAMLPYEPEVTVRLLVALREVFHRPARLMIEDLGTFLVTSPTLPAIRRLLRFGGVDYADFLHSLEDLPERVRLAAPDLVLPPLELTETGPNNYYLRCDAGLPGYANLMLGVLRAMADDYGALAILDLHKRPQGGDIIAIQVVEDENTAGKSFTLGQATA